MKTKKTLKDEAPKFALSKLLPPYNEKGKANFKIRNAPGVYAIFKAGKIIYIGYSKTNLYRTMYRHFQTWTDSTEQYRATFKSLEGIKVAVIYCDTAKVAKLLEGALIIKHRPKANVNIYDGYVTDEKEKEALKKLGQIKPGIYNFSGDLPF